MGSLLLLNSRRYYRRVLATRPIAYWPQWEGAGAVAYDLSGNARNGAYTGVDLGQVGIGDGRVCPWYDGANDYNNVYSAGLAGAFNGAEGSVMVWARVNAAAVWTDGAIRRALHLQADGTNRIYLARSSTNNQFDLVYIAGGTTKQVNMAGLSTVGWMCLALTWNLAAGVNGEMKAYAQGAQVGTTQTALGTWAGALAATLCCIGATSTTPTNVWQGWVAHACIWDRALAPAEVLSLARVR